MSTDSLLGRRIDEYLINKPLGSGGMASVYLALDTRLQRTVALKVIAVPYREVAEYVRRFTREAQAIARLEHPNIVRIYRFGETDDHLLYLAMQFIDGTDAERKLAAVMKLGQPLPPAEVVSIAKEIGAALDHAHAYQVIHRDIKPGNILIATSRQAYLTDFGLSLLVNEGTRGQIFGSPHYIAPEQAVKSSQVTGQTDLYSLGVTVFELLTGHVPFPGDEPVAVALSHLVDAPPLATQFVPTLPVAIDSIFAKALAKKPEERFESGADFAQALADVLLPVTTSGTEIEVVRPVPVVALVAADSLPISPVAAVPISESAPVPEAPILPPTEPTILNAPNQDFQESPADGAVEPMPATDNGPEMEAPPVYADPRLLDRLQVAPKPNVVHRFVSFVMGLLVLLLLISLFAGGVFIASRVPPPTSVVRTLAPMP